MENNRNTGASGGRDEEQRASQTGQNAGQNQKAGQQANNRNDMPPAVAGNKSARPGSQDQDQNAQNSENEDADDEISETEEDSEEDSQLQQTGGAQSRGSSAPNKKPGQTSSRNQDMGDRSTR